MEAPAPNNLPARGLVKWFDCRRGFGFIVDGQGQDIFVHYSAIEGDGFRRLRNGQAVAYADRAGPKGRLAVRVRPILPRVETPENPQGEQK